MTLKEVYKNDIENANEIIFELQEENKRLIEKNNNFQNIINKLHYVIKQIRELINKYEMGKYDYKVSCFELKEILNKMEGK